MSRPAPCGEASASYEGVQDTLFDYQEQAPVRSAHTSSANKGLPSRPAPSDRDLLPDSLSDRGNAKLFVHAHSADFRFVPGLGWHRRAGHRWQLDEADTVYWAAGELAERLARSDGQGVFTPRELEHHRRRALSTAGVHAMLEQAKTAPEMILHASEMDGDPRLLCTPAGVFDLRSGRPQDVTGAGHEHSRSTTVAPLAFPVPRWERFLTDTFGSDAWGRRMISYLQLLLGYSISGEVGAQVVPFLYGQGSNGKSVLLEVVLSLLGDYADAAPSEFLMVRGAENHPTELAELHGRRVIVCAELRPGDRFDEARVEMLTGSDRMKARRMRQNYFSFNPTHKLWLMGNHHPETNAGKTAFRRRIRLIPFARVVTEERRVDNLAGLLIAEEGPGILAWLMEGARRYFSGERDLRGPEAVRSVTGERPEAEREGIEDAARRS
ncbi:DNA primase family protein [Streptomyces sp. NPDC055607]